MAYNARSQANASLPDKIMCDIAHHWATVDQYSKNILEKYKVNARLGKATPAKSGIPCRVHSGGNITELKCNGVCGRTRPLAFFSRNTRRMGQNICKDCSDYYQCCEDGRDIPAPGSNPSMNEEMDQLSGRIGSIDLFRQGEAWGKVNKNTTDILEEMEKEDVVDSSTVTDAVSTVGTMGTTNSTITGYGSGTAPPHLSDTNSAVSKTTVEQGFPFTAYGPQGERREMWTREPAASTTTRDLAGKGKGKGNEIKTTKSGWVKVVGSLTLWNTARWLLTLEQPQRKTAPKMPSYLVYGADSVAHPEGKDDDGWMSDDHC
ncbi:hypothetical protein GQ53DRAFT_826396 [Thozetella sp. PMI_491]|nr:hypothetical protein GQ53DRAFT_826396 [Thozetella sp. PMI_491]